VNSGGNRISRFELGAASTSDKTDKADKTDKSNKSNK
jgi:hypothetical protein